MSDSGSNSIPGVGKDAQVVQNSTGGRQSFVPFAMNWVPQRALLAVAAVVSKGGYKYDFPLGERNWKKIPRSDNENHAAVHLALHMAGDVQDFHLAHAACRALFALEQWLAENPGTMDCLVADSREAFDDRMEKEAASAV